MEPRPYPTQSTACTAFKAVPRRDLGEWGMDYQAQADEPRNAICESAAAGGRGR
jgi:hypothetical protein